MTPRFPKQARSNFNRIDQSILCRILIASLLLISTAVTHADILGKLELSTERVYRGISQTDNNLAPSVSVRLRPENGTFKGAYVGALLHRNDFRNPENAREQTYFVGYRPELNGRLRLDASYIYYDLQQSSGVGDRDWSEAHLRLSVNQSSALVLSAANNWIGNGTTYQVEINHLHPLTNHLSIQALAGVVIAPDDAIDGYGFGELGVIYGITPKIYARTDASFTSSKAEDLFQDRADSTVRLSIGYIF